MESVGEAQKGGLLCFLGSFGEKTYLNHFVGSVEGATTDDVGFAVALDGDGVLADVFEPDVFEVAGA